MKTCILSPPSPSYFSFVHHVSCAGIKALFNHTPFSVSLPAHPNHPPRVPCATLFLVAMFSLTILPYTDLVISRLILNIPLPVLKCRKAK